MQIDWLDGVAQLNMAANMLILLFDDIVLRSMWPVFEYQA